MKNLQLADFISQETKRDPAVFFARLRTEGPLLPMPGFLDGGQAWIVTTYEDAFTILKDPRFVKDPQKFLSPDRPTHSIQDYLAWKRDLLTVDPPDHTRLRALVSKAFTPRMVERLGPRIQQIADELIDAVEKQGQMELIADFAFPLPITVISELLGIPPEDRARFRNWLQTFIKAAFGPQVEGAVTILETFIHYIKTLLETKRAHPEDDLISTLIQAEERGDTLSENELLAMIFLLIIAGHETTVNLIGNGVLALLQHPDQLLLLRSDPTLLPSAVEELLRYTGPVSLASQRWVSEDISMHGVVLHKGDQVFVSLIGADTDPHQFTDPETLNILRQENKHLTFGKGIHYCLGAPLARLEGQIAFGALLRRLPHLQLAEAEENLIWAKNPIMRGLTNLPVTF